jgi:hypothetical protein
LHIRGSLARYSGSVLWRRTGIVIAVTAVGATWLWERGPTPVYRGTVAIEVDAPFLYMLAAFPVLGMACADVLDLLLPRPRWRPALVLAAALAVTIAASVLRVTWHIPLSGHVLLMVFFLGYRLLWRRWRAPADRLEIAFGLTLLLGSAWPKLLWWHDPLTVTVGATLGLALAAAVRLAAGPEWMEKRGRSQVNKLL